MIRYFLVVNIYAFVFLGMYWILLRNRTSHSWSRVYLLSALFISILLPVIPVNLLSDIFSAHDAMAAIQLPEILLNNQISHVDSNATFDIPKGLFIGYVIITGLLLLRFIYNLLAMKVFLSKQTFFVSEYNKVALNTGMGPASFGKYILFPDNQIDNQVLQHEKAHYQLSHHIEKLLLQFFYCFFFPVIGFGFIKKELEIIHEFEADALACDNTALYCKTLLEQHLHINPNYLFQSFYHHPLKRRIMMLNKIKQNNKQRKALLICLSGVAICTLLLLQGAQPLLAQEKKTSAQKSPQGEEKVLAPNDATHSDADVFRSVDQVPEFPGGLKALMSYLSSNIHYPDSAQKNNIEGRVIVQFTVKKDGTISNASIQRSSYEILSTEALRVVNSMPKWKPGKQDGKKVNVLYTLPITFALTDADKGKK